MGKTIQNVCILAAGLALAGLLAYTPATIVADQIAGVAAAIERAAR